ncbi:Sensor histidine kinase LiaS [compost metagenome]
MNDLIFGIISITLIILLLIAGLIIAFFIINRQRVQQEKALIETKLSFEREIRKVETEVSEHIMGQFAQELHDNIGQLLTAVHIQVENQKLDHPELVESFKPTEIYLSEVTQQLRLLSRTLNNDYLGNIGLTAAIGVEVDRLRTLKRVNVHWDAFTGSSNLSKDQELMVFRIFQEISQNVLRHSGASNLYLSIDTRNNGFEFRAQDDGHGFDREEIFRQNKASGLRNIMKRARLAELECEITSSKEGTTVVLKKMAN